MISDNSLSEYEAKAESPRLRGYPNNPSMVT
jgi:hypothetical protein